MILTLVTGGTGFIGSKIVRRLLKGRESVRVLSRHPKIIHPRLRTPGTEFVRGDIFDEQSLTQAMTGCDALIIATQFRNAPFENPCRGLTYMKVDGEGTERLVKFAKEAGIKRIVYMSGAGTREGRVEPWFQAKARAEKAVRDSETNWTIFRPSWSYGPSDRSLNRFAGFARLFPWIPFFFFVPIVGTGRQKIQPVFVEDVAEAVALSLNNPNTYGKILEIGGPQQLTMTEVVKTMLRVMGKRRMIIRLPKTSMKLVAGLVQFLPGRLLTPSGVDFITMEEHVDNAVVTQTLGLSPVSLEVGLGTYLGRKDASSFEAFRRRAA